MATPSPVPSRCIQIGGQSRTYYHGTFCPFLLGWRPQTRPFLHSQFALDNSKGLSSKGLKFIRLEFYIPLLAKDRKCILNVDEMLRFFFFLEFKGSQSSRPSGESSSDGAFQQERFGPRQTASVFKVCSCQMCKGGS